MRVGKEYIFFIYWGGHYLKFYRRGRDRVEKNELVQLVWKDLASWKPNCILWMKLKILIH